MAAINEIKDWEKAGAAVEGYLVPPGESLERPFFPTSRALAWTGPSGLFETIAGPIGQTGSRVSPS